MWDSFCSKWKVPRQNQCTNYSDNRYSQQIPKPERNGHCNPVLSKPWIGGDSQSSNTKDHHWDLKPDSGAAAATTTTTILKVPSSKKDQNVLELVKSLDKEGQKATDKVRKKGHHDSNGENNFYPRNGVSPTSTFGLSSASSNNNHTQRALTSQNNSTSGQQQQPPYPEKSKALNGQASEYNRHYQAEDCHRQEHQVMDKNRKHFYQIIAKLKNGNWRHFIHFSVKKKRIFSFSFSFFLSLNAFHLCEMWSNLPQLNLVLFLSNVVVNTI